MGSALPRHIRSNEPRRVSLGDALSWDEIPALAAALAQRVLALSTLGLAGRHSARVDAPDTAANSLLDTLADYTFMDSLEAEALTAAPNVSEAPESLDGLVVSEIDSADDFERYFVRGAS